MSGAWLLLGGMALLFATGGRKKPRKQQGAQDGGRLPPNIRLVATGAAFESVEDDFVERSEQQAVRAVLIGFRSEALQAAEAARPVAQDYPYIDFYMVPDSIDVGVPPEEGGVDKACASHHEYSIGAFYMDPEAHLRAQPQCLTAAASLDQLSDAIRSAAEFTDEAFWGTA